MTLPLSLGLDPNFAHRYFNGPIQNGQWYNGHLNVTTECQDYFDENKREGVVKRGRKPGRKAHTTKTDMKVKLERSRQSARECRARKKLRYQYLEEQVAHREKAVFMLHKELEQYRQWAKEFDEGNLPEGLLKFVEEQKRLKQDGGEEE